MTHFSSLLFLTLFILQSHLALAYCKDPDCQKMRRLAPLNLTTEQKTAVKALNKETRKKMTALKKERKKHPAPFSLDPLADDYLDSVKTFAKKASAHKENQLLLMAEKRLALYQLLTPKQQQQMRGIEKNPKRVAKPEHPHDKKAKRCNHDKPSVKNTFKALDIKKPQKCHDYTLCDDHKH